MYQESMRFFSKKETRLTAESTFRFIDLFAGIGGFHQAAIRQGGTCVFASEIDQSCQHVYEQNYGIRPNGDIKEVSEKEIPAHDLLCAGFPCQTFSKAGNRMGLEDTRGTLFFEIARILKYHKTKYILLENVRNLVSHDNGNTWKTVSYHLKELGYRLTAAPIIVSPHQFGVPQLRERVVILGIYDPKNTGKAIPLPLCEFAHKDQNSINSVLSQSKVEPKYSISQYEEFVLSAWDQFYQGIDERTIGFPIWAEYFKTSSIALDIPLWKRVFIEKNQDLYARNKTFIDSWLQKYDNLERFSPTHRKMEWQAGDSIDSLWDGVIQFRPSGIRVKRPTCFPALVAMVQIPIIGKYRRRLTVQEVARLQSFPDTMQYDSNDQQAYKQFGNAVNVEVIDWALKYLFSIGQDCVVPYSQEIPEAIAV